MMFVSWLAQSVAPPTIAVYLAAVRSLHIDAGLPDPTADAPRLRRVLRGIQRTRSRARPSRRPITKSILDTIHTTLATASPAADAAMFWAACCVAFFGFLRVSEFTAGLSIAPARQLCLADVEILAGSPPSAIRLRIKASKTDPLAVGCFVYIGRSSRTVCPVQAVLAYLTHRGSDPGPFFRWHDGSPLTPVQVNFYLRDILTRAGYQGNYSSHSFRIVAGTATAAAGLPEHLIQTLGRWSSSAYLRYICTSPETLAHVASLL